MLDHLAWMLSDSTGIPPQYAKPAGMVQETYGSLQRRVPRGRAGRTSTTTAFIELWRSRTGAGRSPFRFGYVDKDGAGHLVVTKPKP